MKSSSMDKMISSSPRTELRRRRELVLKARRIASANSSSSMSSSDDEVLSDESDGRQRRNRRCSRRQLIRSKQQDTGGIIIRRAASADRQQHVAVTHSQVHWKVHKMCNDEKSTMVPAGIRDERVVVDVDKHHHRLTSAVRHHQQQQNSSVGSQPTLFKQHSTLPPPLPIHSSSQDSSPLDTIPVKEVPVRELLSTIDQRHSTMLLNVSQNSAFRPIRPAAVPPLTQQLPAAVFPIRPAPTMRRNVIGMNDQHLMKQQRSLPTQNETNLERWMARKRSIIMHRSGDDDDRLSKIIDPTTVLSRSRTSDNVFVNVRASNNNNPIVINNKQQIDRDQQPTTRGAFSRQFALDETITPDKQATKSWFVTPSRLSLADGVWKSSTRTRESSLGPTPPTAISPSFISAIGAGQNVSNKADLFERMHQTPGIYRSKTIDLKTTPGRGYLTSFALGDSSTNSSVIIAPPLPPPTNVQTIARQIEARAANRRHNSANRYQTQPITQDEVSLARHLFVAGQVSTRSEPPKRYPQHLSSSHRSRLHRQREDVVVLPSSSPRHAATSRSPHRQQHLASLNNNINSNSMIDAELADVASPSIFERLSALKLQGAEQWKTRIAPIDAAIETTDAAVENRKAALIESATQWRCRVADKDTEQLTVNGKLQKAGLSVQSTPTTAAMSTPSGRKPTIVNTLVQLPELDEGLDQFYPTLLKKPKTNGVAVPAISFDDIISTQPRLTITKNIARPPRRQPSSRNPIKSLSARSTNASYTDSVKVTLRPSRKFVDSSTPQQRPYTTINDNTTSTTGGNNDQSLWTSPTQHHRQTQLADEAVRALEAIEDYSSVQLKSINNSIDCVRRRLLIQFRGRKTSPSANNLFSGTKSVDVRLVCPNARSVHNSGCFLLVMDDKLFLFEGKFSSVLEKAKANQLALQILDLHHFGCAASHLSRITDETTGVMFWQLLDANDAANHCVPPYDRPPSSQIDAHDQYFEQIMSTTTRIFELSNDGQLTDVPVCAPLSGALLDPDKVLVFDFGVELYVWCGRNTDSQSNKLAMHLANEQIYQLPYTGGLSDRLFGDADGIAVERRPDWCLFEKIRQGLEHCLFCAKFVDSIQSNRLRNNMRITTTTTANMIETPSVATIEPDELGRMMASSERVQSELILEDVSVGRGRSVVQHDVLMQKFEICTEMVSMWRVVADGADAIASDGHFFSNQCYIVLWRYRISHAGARTFDGRQRKTTDTGRSRCVFFYWIGVDSSIAIRGACGLAVRSLDTERNVHCRVEQGHEPAAFLQLFDGHMIIHSGAPVETTVYAVLTGADPAETRLAQLNEPILRSQGVYIWPTASNVTIWLGAYASQALRDAAHRAAEHICEQQSVHFDFIRRPSIRWCVEGEGTSGLPRDVRVLRPLSWTGNTTMRLIHVTSTGAVDVPSELYSIDAPTTFAYVQDELYNVTQPAIFLLDQGDRLWIWQGDAMDADDEAIMHKFRLHQLFALRFAVAYWQQRWTDDNEHPAYVVYAGVEPDAFKALFLEWTDNVDAMTASLKLGRKSGDMIEMQAMAREVCTRYFSADRLRNRPLPAGVDASRLEYYLSESEFDRFFGMSKCIFDELPTWKKIRLKKERSFF